MQALVFKANNIDEVKRASREAIDAALEAIGQQAQENAVEYCPEDTGNLKRSITHELGDMRVFVGSNVKYAPYVEFIDRYHHEKGQAHYLRDAIVLHGDEYREILEKHLKG